MNQPAELLHLETVLVGMQASAIAAGEECLSAIADIARACPEEHAESLAARIRIVRELAANACVLWDQVVECTGAGTWTGYGVPCEPPCGPSVRA